MNNAKTVKGKKKSGYAKPENKSHTIAYRMKCARTANGLTHFVMYGDVPKKQMPL